MGGVIFPTEELLLPRHFTTVGPGAIVLFLVMAAHKIQGETGDLTH